MVLWPREWFERTRAVQAMRGVSGVPVVLAANQDHVQYCFDVLSAHFSGDSGPVPTFEDTFWCAPSSVDFRRRSCSCPGKRFRVLRVG